MIRWRIYYADGSTYDNTQGLVTDYPVGRGVICIVQRHDKNNVERIDRGDYYYYRSDLDRWYPADLFGIIWQFHAYPATRTALLFGETVSEERFDEIIAHAYRDPDFPQRAGGVNTLENPATNKGRVERG